MQRHGAWSVVVLAIVSVGLLASVQQPSSGAGFRYIEVEHWAQLPPGETFGGVSGVAIDSQGALYAFRRDAGDVWVLDPVGRFLRAWGKGIAKRTHSIRVDHEGFIWTTDSAGHQVKKFAPDGRLVVALGAYDVAGDGPDRFDGPTDVVVAPNGEFFVTDGYGNSRVVKFSRDGTYLKEWGTNGSGPGQFQLPHAIVMDSRGRLIVADRTNRRLQLFDTDGNFLTQWTHLGVPYGLYIAQDDTLYIADFENAQIVVANAQDASVLGTVEDTPNVHGVAADDVGNVYAASNSRFYLRKFARVNR